MAGRIVLKLSGFRSDQGLARVVVFGPDLSHYTEDVPIEEGRAEYVLEDMEPGRYAVSVFHDADADGALDTDEQGQLAEGVSDLDRSRVVLEGDEVVATVEMRY